MSKSFSWWPIARVLILGISAGAASGVVAAVATSRSLDNYAAYLLDRYRAPDVTVEKPSPIPGTYEEALQRVRAAGTALAMFAEPSVNSTQASQLIGVESVVGLGAVISADGWVLTTKTATVSFADPTKMDVWISGERYAVASVVDDTKTDMRLLKVNGSELVSLGFGDAADVLSGEMVFGLASGDVVRVAQVSASDALFAPGSHAAEDVTTTWQLSSDLVLMPLVNAVGDLVGFAGSDGYAVPLHHALAFVQSVIRTGSADHAALGVYVVDLAAVLNADGELRQGVESGALILAPTADKRAIVRGGPAAEAGLAVRDVILAVDGESVTSTSTLAEYLATYSPGQSARLTVLRGGETLTVTVTFAAAGDLVY